MSSQQDVIYGLMNELEEALDKGFPLLSNLAVVKKDTVINILDKLYAALPDEVKEARALLRRKDELPQRSFYEKYRDLYKDYWSKHHGKSLRKKIKNLGEFMTNFKISSKRKGNITEVKSLFEFLKAC